jgi:hypothetical protein
MASSSKSCDRRSNNSIVTFFDCGRPAAAGILGNHPTHTPRSVLLQALSALLAASGQGLSEGGLWSRQDHASGDKSPPSALFCQLE